MPIDPSIYFNRVQPGPGAQYYANQYLQGQGQGIQNAIHQAQLGQMQQQQADEDLMRRSLVVDAQGNVDRQATMANMQGNGMVQARMQSQWAGQDQEQAKTQAMVSKERRESREQQYKNVSDYMGHVGGLAMSLTQLPDEQSRATAYPKIAAQAKADSARFGLKPEDLDLPDQYPGEAALKQFAFRTLNAKEQVDLTVKAEIENRQKKGMAETERHNRAMENKPNASIVALNNPKPPAGYRYTADGNLEAIPGGPAAQKLDLANDKIQGVKEATQATIETGKRLLSHPGLSGAVGTWGATKYIPGTDAASFAAELDAFKAQNFIPQVQAMKGMGQLSDAEGKKLTDAVGALSYNMKESDFKASLQRIITKLELAAAKEPKAPGAEAKPNKLTTKVNPANGKTYYQHPDGKFYLEPPK